MFLFSICVLVSFHSLPRNQSNQEQFSLCCSSLYFRVFCALTTGCCNAFQHIFVNKKIGVLGSIFPDYAFSFGYGILYKKHDALTYNPPVKIYF